MFFEYRQNNSGGSFHEDAKSGISHIVVIEANSADEANARAQSIGLYFDGEGDCSCCGDRWSAAYDLDKGDEVPSHYGEPIIDNLLSDKNNPWKWVKGPEGYIHYLDGRIEPVDFPKSDKVSNLV